MSIESVRPSNHLILCHPLLLLSLIFPSIRSWLFASDGQSIEASSSILLMNIQGWFPLEVTDLIFLLSKELSRVFSSTTGFNKGCCSHQAIILQLPDSEGTQNGDKWAKSSASAATPSCVPWKDSGWRKTGYWPKIIKVHITGITSKALTLASSHIQKH